jgi:transcriptional regulator with XRE-family HTH domain
LAVRSLILSPWDNLTEFEKVLEVVKCWLRNIAVTEEGVTMLVKTTVFELCNGEYKNLSELAQAMGISVSQLYRVRKGERNINQKFIVGAIKAFPGYQLADLFYLSSEPAAKEKQRMESTKQALGRFNSAVRVHGISRNKRQQDDIHPRKLVQV